MNTLVLGAPLPLRSRLLIFLPSAVGVVWFLMPSKVIKSSVLGTSVMWDGATGAKTAGMRSAPEKHSAASLRSAAVGWLLPLEISAKRTLPTAFSRQPSVGSETTGAVLVGSA